MTVKGGYISIYLSDHEIHAIELTQGYKNVVVHNYSKVELPNGIIKNGRIVEPNAFQQKLIDLINSAKPGPINSRNLLFVVPEELTFNQFFTMPGDLEEENLDSLIPNEAEKYVPFSKEDIYWDFDAAHKSGNGTCIEYSAVSKNILNEYLAIFKNIGLEPILVTNGHEAYKVLPSINSEPSSVVLELNKDSIRLICIHDNIIHKIDSYDFDYNSFLELIAQNINPETHEVHIAEIPALDFICSQIKQELGSHECFKDLKSLNLWGSQIKDKYLYTYLEKCLALPFEVKELWNPVNFSPDTNSNKEAIDLINMNKIPFGILCGISSVFFFESDAKCTNLLPAEERRSFVSSTFDTTLNMLGLSVVALNIALIFVLGYFGLNYTFEYQKLQKETKNFEELIYGDRYTELKTNILSFNSEVSKLHALDNSIIDIPSVYENLINISSVGVELVTLSYDKSTSQLAVNGIAETRKTLLAYKDQLDLLDGVGNIDFPISNLDKSENISFEIKIDINTDNEI